MTGHIPHHAARSLMFNLPPPDLDADVPNPVKWNPAQPNDGLGYRSVAATAAPAVYTIAEIPLAPTPIDGGAGVVDAAADGG